MRKAIIAAAAASMVMGAQADSGEPVNLARILAYAVTATGAVKAIIETYDWARARWFPPPQQFKAGDLWQCDTCRFPPPGSASTPDDDYLGGAFIAQQFGGRAFYAGQSIVVCDRLQCFLFRYDGEKWFASGPAFKDPGVGYANTPAVPTPRSYGGGEGSASSSYRPSTGVWRSDVVYNPGSRPFRTGSVTVICCESYGGGGGGSGRFDTEFSSY
jgi:hypothetical protein